MKALLFLLLPNCAWEIALVQAFATGQSVYKAKRDAETAIERAMQEQANEERRESASRETTSCVSRRSD